MYLYLYQCVGSKKGENDLQVSSPPPFLLPDTGEIFKSCPRVQTFGITSDTIKRAQTGLRTHIGNLIMLHIQ